MGNEDFNIQTDLYGYEAGKPYFVISVNFKDEKISTKLMLTPDVFSLKENVACAFRCLSDTLFDRTLL